MTRIAIAQHDAIALAYLKKLPTVIPVGQVLVHNSVRPTRRLGSRGFRAWLSAPNTKLRVCNCQWAPALGRHFRTRLAAIALAAVFASASAAAAQTTVYTNVIDGKSYRESIVRVERPAQPAAPVPSRS